jgi:hypothetical protein
MVESCCPVSLHLPVKMKPELFIDLALHGSSRQQGTQAMKKVRQHDALR